MSWMDSWSRPTKSQAAPPPYYLTNPAAPYCHTCGRIIGQRRANSSKSAVTEVKFCSDRCKRTKPSTAAGSLEMRIETALTALLQGLAPPPQVSGNPGEAGEENGGMHDEQVSNVKKSQTTKKGDPRIVVQLSEVETAVFGHRQDPEKMYGRRRNRAFRGVKDDGDWKSVDMVERSGQPMQPNGTHPPVGSQAQAKQKASSAESPIKDLQSSDTEPKDSASDSASDGDEDPSPGAGVRLHQDTPDMIANHVRPAQSQSDVNFAEAGGERGWAERIAETPEMLAKRREGQKRAEEKELVRQVARRAVVFGLEMKVEKGQGKSGKGGKKGGKKAREAEAQMEQGDEKVRKKCEAVMSGAVVEPSFAKGDWEIRWRDELDQGS